MIMFVKRSKLLHCLSANEAACLAQICAVCWAKSGCGQVVVDDCALGASAANQGCSDGEALIVHSAELGCCTIQCNA